MTDVEESFTVRILKRASLRRNRDGNRALNSSNEISQRRYNILKAIDEPSCRRRTSIGIHDSQSFDQSLDGSRNSFNLTGISWGNNNDENAFNAYKNIDEDYKRNVNYIKFFKLGKVISTETSRNKLGTGNSVQTEDNSLGNSLIDEDNSEGGPLESLPKIMKDNIKPSWKNQAVLKASENAYKNIDEDSKRGANYIQFYKLGNVISTETSRNKLGTGNSLQTEDNSLDNSLIGEYNSEERPSESLPKIMKDNIKPSWKNQAVLKASENAYKNIDENSKKGANYIQFYKLGNVISTETSRNKLGTGNSLQTKGNSLIGEDNSEERPTESLPKIMKDNIKPTWKNQAVLKASENKAADTILDINLSQAPQSLTSSLVFIEDSDAETENENPRAKKTFTTEAVIEMCNRVYEAMELKCETSDVKDLKIVEDISTRNLKNINEDSSCPEKFVNDDSNLRKMLFSTESHVDPKSDGSEKYEEIASVQNDTISYDAEKFLIGALGDKLDNTTNHDDTLSCNRTISKLTASDLVAEVTSPLQKKVMAALNLSMNESISPRSSRTLNKSMRIYNSVSQRIKKKFRPGVKPKKDVEIDPAMSSGSEEIDMIQDLLHEIKSQQTLMNEAAKTLHSCDKRKNVLSVSERVETEALLLLASLRRKAALEEIKSITSDEIKESASFRETGEVTVSDISLDLRYCLHSQLRNNEVEWFIVAVSQGLNVWITPAICGSTNDSGKLRFSESTSIPNLTPGFKINVQVFSLRVRRDNRDDDEDTRIHRQSRGTSCLPYSSILASPTKLLKKIKSPGSPTNDHNNAWKCRNSAFVLSGVTEFSLQDLSSSSPWSLKRVPTNSTLNGQIHLNLACRLHFTMSHQGFLNYYEEIGGFGNWNRRWCVLKGHELMFWNYPLEQDVKEPLKIIEMMSCVSNEITTVDKSICPKPRTLLIETSRSRKAEDKDSMIVECTSTSTYVRHLLSYDSVEEINEWAEKLNHVLFALEEWHVIEQRTHAQVTDL